jgi:hypothetical protein
MKDLTPDINNCAQNHPELIIKDLQLIGDIYSHDIRRILKYRGINKWLRVRRLLIQLKHRWKDEIKALEEKRKVAKSNGKYVLMAEIKGRKEQLIDCRQQIRALCHSPRDIDFPLNPKDFGEICRLPKDFPARPHKRWFWNA